MSGLKVHYKFHPVGQGLFASGKIKLNGVQPFNWVYDCGSLSEENVKRAIKEYCTTKSLGNFCGDDEKRHLDLLAISHFDKDHINGIGHLLSNFSSIGVVLLPYVGLLDRIEAIAELDAQNAELVEFIWNPLKYLLGNNEIKIGRVVFVLPTQKIIENEKTEKFGDALNTQWEIQGNPLKLENLEQKDDIRSNLSVDMSDNEWGGYEKKIFFVKNTKLTCVFGSNNIIWEFVPYNDKKPLKDKEISEEERSFLSKRVEDIKTTTATADPEDKIEKINKLIQCIKQEYVEFLSPTNGKINNRISLFLYSAPIGNFRKGQETLNPDFMGCPICRRCFPHRHAPFHHKPLHTRRSGGTALYTGDGYLKEKEYVDLRCAMNGRLKKIAYFQVMHHGSEKNWHEGLGGKIRPRFSIFSSNPCGDYFHPDIPVVLDFCPYNPAQVDEEHGFVASIIFPE